MEWPIFFPNIKTKSTKDLILRLLTREKSMTNQQVFSSITKQFGVSVTYQSVRQALMELKEAGVLEKNKKEYSLSARWIQTLFDYSSLLKKKYIDNMGIKIIDENTKEVQLNSLFEMGHFILYSFKDHFFDMDKGNELYVAFHHLWIPFFDKRKRQMLAEFFQKNKNYIYIANKGMINRIFSVFYRKYGKVKLGVKFDEFFDIIIHGDCIAKIYMPVELRQRMDGVYRSKNPFKLEVIHEFSDLAFETYPIRILIRRDRAMAEEMKNKIRRLTTHS